MSTTKIAEQFIAWRIRGVIVSEKRLMDLLASDVSPGSSDKQLDALYKMISNALRDITHMQNEIITLQMILDDQEKPVK
jgi:hypothetical protein